MKKIIQQLQEITLYDEFLFSKKTPIMAITEPIVCNDILIRKQNRFIGYTDDKQLPFERFEKANGVDIYAYKNTLTFLGILLLELLFHSKTDFIEIKLPQPQSEIKQLYVYLDREHNPTTHTGLQIEQEETYSAFKYFAQAVDKFPLTSSSDRVITADAMPYFSLACSDYQSNFTKYYIDKADQLILTISTSSLVQMSELFLDIGRVENKQTEVCLENPLTGFGGVSERSIDARFWLPNSFGFYTEDINELKF